MDAKMELRELLKKSDIVVGLVRDSRKMLNIPNLVRRNKIIKRYLSSNEIKKLQLGAGSSFLDGWLGTDIVPQSDNIAFLDATKPFPFDDDIFDCIYSEHMIEHISWHEALSMLLECKRVLKPGGSIRIATPDLEILIGIYNGSNHPLSKRYIQWITDKFIPDINIYNASYVINNAFRNWGHQFLYDGNLLEILMLEAGFTDIVRCSPGESDNEHLRGIGSHGQNVDNNEMASFETMVFEGKCPI